MSIYTTNQCSKTMRITACRICNGRNIVSVLDLGMMPAPNRFPESVKDFQSEEMFPLRFCRCEDCGLAMIDEVVAPEKLFSTYHYLTAASSPLVTHFRALAEEVQEKFRLTKKSKVLDIGANDGTLLLEFQKHGTKTLGIDPAKNVALIAETKGVHVLPEFFSHALAKKVKKKEGEFDVITATNVFAHTHDIHDFTNGVKELLAPNGVFIVEFAHLLEMFEHKFFDVIYHEHLSFYALQPLVQFFEGHGMKIFDAKKILTQGGSLRIYVTHEKSKKHDISPAIAKILKEEKKHGLDTRESFEKFADYVRGYQSSLRTLLQKLKMKGKTIVGVGAPAKGVILLNYCRIDGDIIDYLVDSTPLKQHRFLPGVHIPVFSEEKLAEEKIDYFIILAHNFQDEIIQKLSPYRDRGAKIILPFPKIHTI